MRAWLSSEIRRKHFNPNGYVVSANDSFPRSASWLNLDHHWLHVEVLPNVAIWRQNHSKHVDSSSPKTHEFEAISWKFDDSASEYMRHV